MAGSRHSDEIELVYAPGVVTNLADRDAKGRFKDSNRVRWHKGLPEKIGGWQRQTLTGANNGVYIGVARALHDWASLDTQQWIAMGTHCKLYLVNNGVLYDITPLRKTSNLTNPLAVQVGSATITVTDPDHRVAEGDHISIIAAAAIGGFEVSGAYDVDEVIDPNTYTVSFTSNFNATVAAGGGGVTINYDVGCGLAQNGELYGYGTGPYGESTYGTPRAPGSGVLARMRIWSLDNWGEDLVCCPSDGAIYWWDRTLGPNSRARLIQNAPRGVQRILVNPENKHLIALGCTSAVTGDYDPMRIRWCSQEDLNDWVPDTDDTAGGRRLDHGSRIVTGVKSRSTNYVWTDTQLYSLSYAPPGDFIPNPLGACKIVGPNAAIDVNGIVYMMVFDDFMVFNGVLQVLPCEVHTKIFGDEDRNIEGEFDRTQAEAVYCSSYTAKNEVKWLYPKRDGTTGYVVFNYTPGAECWYYGTMPRTAYHDVSEAITGYKTNPYGVNGGYLYKHEVGKDEVEGDTTTPQAWFLESYDNNIGGSDKVFLINALVPNFDRISGSMLVTLKKKAKPRQQVYQERGPYLIEETTTSKGVRCKGSQVAIRWESNGELGEDFRMSTWMLLATPYGARTGVQRPAAPVVLPGAPVLSGEVLAPPAPPEVLSMQAWEDVSFSSVFFLEVPEIPTIGESSYALIWLTLQAPSTFNQVPDSIMFGGVEADIIRYVRAPVAEGSGFIHAVLALVDLTGELPFPLDAIEGDWSLAGEEEIGIVLAIVDGVAPSILGFGDGVVSVEESAAALPALSVQPNDIVLAFGIHHGATVPAYENGSGDAYEDTAGSNFATNHYQHGAYRLQTAAGSEVVSSPLSDFVGGVAVVARGG